jgi:hypothetical protein
MKELRVSLDARPKLLQDIRRLQICKSKTTFEKACDLFLEKWHENGDSTIDDFLGKFGIIFPIFGVNFSFPLEISSFYWENFSIIWESFSIIWENFSIFWERLSFFRERFFLFLGKFLWFLGKFFLFLGKFLWFLGKFFLFLGTFLIYAHFYFQRYVCSKLTSTILTKTDKFYIKINISFYLGSINLNFKNFLGQD